MPWDRTAYDRERDRERRKDPKRKKYCREWAYKQPSQIMRRLVVALREWKKMEKVQRWDVP